MITDKEWQLLKDKIEDHSWSLDDAPYHGWSGEFIRGFREALARIKKDMQKIEDATH